jgi:hypothetical protein
MTPPKLTDEQIEAIYTRYGGDMLNCAASIARARDAQWQPLLDAKDAEIAKLSEDAARLDYLDKHGRSTVFAIVNNWYTRPDYGMPYKKHKSLRAAIDAARSQQ